MWRKHDSTAEMDQSVGNVVFELSLHWGVICPTFTDFTTKQNPFFCFKAITISFGATVT